MSVGLHGWTVVVTRPEGADGPLSSLLRQHGARVLLAPTLEIGAPRQSGPMDEAVARIESYDWIVLTSARAVAALAERLPGPPVGPRIATVGPSTTRAAEEAGWSVRLEGPGSGGAALADALLQSGAESGTRVLFPRSSRARQELGDALRVAGWTVDDVVAYEARIPDEAPMSLGSASTANAVTFTSPSAVDGWQALLGDRFCGSLAEPHVVAIGTTTQDRLQAAGVTSHRAPEATFEGIVRCLLALRTSLADPTSSRSAT